MIPSLSPGHGHKVSIRSVLDLGGDVGDPSSHSIAIQV